MLFESIPLSAAAIVALLTTTVLSAAIGPRAVTYTQVVDQLTALDSQAETISTLASQIELSVDNPYVNVINAIQTQIDSTQSDLDATQGSAAFATTADASAVCMGYQNFVVSEQGALNEVISKASAGVPVYYGPVASALRSLEASLDAYSEAVNGTVPSCQAELTSSYTQLETTLAKAVCTYQDPPDPFC